MKTVKLGDICAPKQWPTLSKAEMSESGFPVYGANGKIGFAETFTHERPTILIGCRGSCGTVHVTEPRSYANGNAMALDELDEESASIEYLRHYFKARGFADVVTGTSQPQIIRQKIVTVEIPLPPLAEQQRIAGILDAADALRAQRRRALARLDDLARSLFLHHFGDPVSNPKSWPVVKFDALFEEPLRNGVSPSKVGTVIAKVLTLSAITGDDFEPNAWKTGTFMVTPPAHQCLNDRDFLICRGNGSIELVGKGFFPSASMPDMVFPDTMIAARISQAVERGYIQTIWNAPAVRAQLKAGARTTNGTFKVNQTVIENITVPLPPLALQQQFACELAAVEAQKARQRAHLAQLDTLFASLQHDAFTGGLGAAKCPLRP